MKFGGELVETNFIFDNPTSIILKEMDTGVEFKIDKIEFSSMEWVHTAQNGGQNNYMIYSVKLLIFGAFKDVELLKDRVNTMCQFKCTIEKDRKDVLQIFLHGHKLKCSFYLYFNEANLEIGCENAGTTLNGQIVGNFIVE